MPKVLPAPEPDGPLLPFEQRQLSFLLNQFHGTSERIRNAFLLEVVPPALTEGRPKVVRLRSNG